MSEEIKLKQLRIIRHAELSACDWTQGNDSQLSSAKKQEWLTYRQSLRDITNNLDTTTIELYLDEFQEIQFSNFTWISKPIK